jgi:NAD(P)-dependent dehydrogenase (short-subunit alcohol dehydrogenase family)
METEVLGRKLFLADDQIRFAKLSGDWNPMHMDPVAARRTQAGAPVVHGIHTALRGLDYLAQGRDLPPVTRLKASFGKMVYVGDEVEYRLGALSETAATVDAFVGDVTVAKLNLAFSPPRPAGFRLDAAPSLAVRPERAIDLDFEAMAGQTGRVGAPATQAEVAAAFPAAARIWPPRLILATLCSTTLVGMVCPGLHSIFSGLTLNAGEPDSTGDTLAYRVDMTDARFRMVRMQVQGDGVWGVIDCFARVPPVAQPSLEALAGLCAPDEFAGATALIVGGSRGLGELTAKLLATGGARMIVTYATGQADAAALASAIRDWGGSCDSQPFDFRAPAAPQLANLSGKITHVYYFATPRIGRRKSGLFDAARYAEFHDCYVRSFYDLFMTLHAGAPDGLRGFYPSSVFVEERPEGMTEYAMAKAAGEILCADLNATLRQTRITVSRLQRLPTDQTASVTPVTTDEPVRALLPLIREVQNQRGL